jgi:hypothetical protein
MAKYVKVKQQISQLTCRDWVERVTKLKAKLQRTIQMCEVRKVDIDLEDVNEAEREKSGSEKKEKKGKNGERTTRHTLADSGLTS